jgi:hypothetical protein
MVASVYSASGVPAGRMKAAAECDKEILGILTK